MSEINNDEEVEEAYVFMDFGDKVNDDLFQDKIFFRISNLDTAKPLIQFNDHIFKGQYSDCVGTNLFFEDVEDTPPRNIFQEDHIQLKHTVTQFKIISLTPVQIPSELKDMPEPDYAIKINTNNDYQTLLKKFADGTLDIKDDLEIVPKTVASPSVNIPKKKTIDKPDVSHKSNGKKTSTSNKIEENTIQMEVVKNDLPLADNREKEEKSDGLEFIDILNYKYEKLKKLALRPNRRKVEIETVEECEEYRKAYEYNSIKSQIMKPSDYFRTLSSEYNRETLVGAVDIDRCVIQGILKPSDKLYRILTEEEKVDVLTLENLENLSMLARYWVLKSQLQYLESLKLSMSKGKLKVENDGRTIDDSIVIQKRLIHVVNGILQENYYYNSDQDTVSDDDSSD